jgi:predicted phosphodiesterase
MKTIVCADIHGNLTLLQNILAHSKFTDEDILVCAGDFCDIGLYTVAIQELLEKNNTVTLLGNHELAHLLGQSIQPYDYKLDSIPNLISGWRKKTLSGEWEIAYAVDDILVTHAGVSDFLAEKLHLQGLTSQQMAEKINKKFLEGLSINYDDPNQLELIGNKWFGYDDVFSPLWYRPLLYEKFGKISNPAPVRQIAGHTPNHCYDSFQIKWLEEMGFYLIDPYMGGRMSLPGYCKYALVEDGKISVVEYFEETSS